MLRLISVHSGKEPSHLKTVEGRIAVWVNARQHRMRLVVKIGQEGAEQVLGIINAINLAAHSSCSSMPRPIAKPR
jgi:hypothetical protein